MRHGEDVVNRCYLIINLDFIFRRLVAARVVDDAVGCGIRRRRALLRTNIGRLPSHAQPRARDAADDVSPKAAPEVDVQKKASRWWKRNRIDEGMSDASQKRSVAAAQDSRRRSFGERGGGSWRTA